MSAQWIKLTGKDDAPLFVNMASVSMIRPRKRRTRIWFIGHSKDYVDVVETAEEIILRLDEHLLAARVAEMKTAPAPALIETRPVNGHVVKPEMNGAVKAEMNGAATKIEIPPVKPSAGVAAKLARASAVKISSAPIAPARSRADADSGKAVAEERDQRAKRRVSAILDERREQLARKLESMRKDKDAR